MSIQAISSISTQAAITAAVQSPKATKSQASDQSISSPSVVVTIDNSSVKPESPSDLLSRTTGAENAMLSVYNQIDWSKVKGLTPDQIKAAQEHNAQQFANEESDIITFSNSYNLDTSKISFAPISNMGGATDTSGSLIEPGGGEDESASVGSGGDNKTSIPTTLVLESTSNAFLGAKSASEVTRPDAQAAAALAVLQAATSGADDESQARTDLYV